VTGKYSSVANSHRSPWAMNDFWLLQKKNTAIVIEKNYQVELELYVFENQWFLYVYQLEQQYRQPFEEWGEEFVNSETFILK
jgi:hypothetical protein